MKKRIISVLTVSAILLSVITACNESIETPPASSGTTATAAPAPVTGEETTGKVGVPPETVPPITAEPLAPEEAADFIPVAADLTVDVFKRSFAEKPNANNLVSPLSVMLALSMTANGADGKTLSEMEAVLGRGITLGDLNKLLSAYANNLPSEEGSKLNVANSIWCRDDDGFVVEEEFRNINRYYYAAEIRKADFNNPKTVDEINDWVSNKTDKMIEEILEEIPSDAVMYLINAIAFDSEWDRQYKEHEVSKGDFTAFDGKVQNTDFMRSIEDTYIETDNATGFVKPYKGGLYSFAALLPNEDVDIGDFIGGLTGESLMKTLNSARGYGAGVSTSMPKFTFEYEIEMNNMLFEMGMPTAFNPSAADFGKLARCEAGNLYISRVLHKTFIEVDERGTKAAAVTSVEVNCESAPVYKYVTLDRPFVFAIVDNSTNLPIFIGALMEIPK